MYTFLMFCVTVTWQMYLAWFLVILLYKKFDARLDKLHSDSTQSLVSHLSVIHSQTLLVPCLCRMGLWLQVDKESANDRQIRNTGDCVESECNCQVEHQNILYRRITRNQARYIR